MATRFIINGGTRGMRHHGLLPQVVACVLVMAAAFAQTDAVTTTSGDENVADNQAKSPSARLVIRGFSHAEKLANALAQAYADEHADAPEIRVEGAAFEAGVSCLYDGSCDAVLLPRLALRSERARLKFKRQAELVSYPVAQAAVSIYVHPANTTSALTLSQLGKVFSSQILLWQDVGYDIKDPVPTHQCQVCRMLAEQGMKADAHAHRLHINKRNIFLYGTRIDDGSAGVFAVRAMNSETLPGSLPGMQTTGEVIGKVAESKFAIGFGRWGTYDGVKTLAVKACDDCPAVKPTAASIADHSYPLAHYLYFCTANRATGALQDFLAFTESAAGQRVVENAGLDVLPVLPSMNKSGHDKPSRSAEAEHADGRGDSTSRDVPDVDRLEDM